MPEHAAVRASGAVKVIGFGARRCLAVTLVLLLTGLASFASPAGAATAQQVEPGVRDSIVRLYHATFDRAPDPGGLDFWVAAYVHGTPLWVIGNEFMASPEFRARYGQVDDATFVDLLYRNVMGRGADEGGRAYWTGLLAGGTPRVSVLLGFSESAELINRTGTAPPVAPRPPAVAPRPSAPPVPANSGTGRRIVYANSAHRVWLVEADGRVARTYLVSGRANTPRPGTYSVFSKSPTAWAGYDGITMKHMVRFARGTNLAIGFHAIPRDRWGRPLQTEAQLGTYRSSGCVRQADRDAEFLYGWAPVGTRVVVLS
jgi:hypothetical protein